MTTPRSLIESQSLRLVQITRQQAQRLADGDPLDLAHGAGWPPTDTFDAVRMALEGGDPDSLPWLVLLRGAPAGGGGAELVIGDVGCKGTPTAQGEVEIGYGLAAPYRGRGLGTRAVGRFVEWLLSREDVSRVTAQTDHDNVASRRLLERIGFAEVRNDIDSTWYARRKGLAGH